MKGIVLLLGALLCLAISARGRRISDDDDVEHLPIEGRGRGGSQCIIHRSIDVDDNDDDDDKKRKARQASLGNGSVFIPSAAADNPSSSSSSSSSNEPSSSSSSSGGGGSSSSSSGSDGSQIPQMQQIQQLLNSRYPPMKYSGYRPEDDDFGPNDTDLDVSALSNIGGYPQYYQSGTKYKYKGQSGGGGNSKKKGSGNINCIIITKTKKKKPQRQQEPQKLFGFIPLSRRRRSLAKHIKALKNQ